MGIPIQAAPTYTCVLSDGREVKFRPFLVKEQKVLTIAKESESTKQTIESISAMIKAVTQDFPENDDLDLNDLPMYDIEYLFIKIRAVSVGETVKLGLRCQETGCQGTGEVTLNLEEVEVTSGAERDPKVMISDDVGVILRDPKFGDMKHFDNVDEIDQPVEVLKGSIVSIFDQESSYDADDVSKKDMVDFVDSLTFKQVELLGEYFDGLPKLEHEVDFTCKICETQQSKTISGLNSFF